VTELDLVQVDARVAALRAVTDEVAARLIELESDTTVKLVVQPGLTGASGERAKAMQASMERLWASLPLASDHLTTVETERAKERRADRALLTRLLTAPLVGTPKVSIEHLVQSFRVDLDIVDSTVRDIGDRWHTLLPAIDSARSTLAAITSDLGELAEVTAAMRTLTHVESTLGSDPLAVPLDGAGSLTAQVASAQAAANRLRDQRDGVRDMLVLAERDLQRLDDLVRAGANAHDAARTKVLAPELLEPLDASTLIDSGDRALRPWLERLQRRPGREWQATIKGLAAWRAVCDGALSSADTIKRANEAPLAQRNELRGRLDAMAAKAASRGAAERNGASEALAAARDLLFAAPCDLRAAEQAVDHYIDLVEGT
jgi:hypothetical protein